MIGDECTPVRSMLEIFYPLKEGVIHDWDQMEHIWNYSYYTKLGLSESDMGEKKVLLTEAAENAQANRNKMGEIMFEKYGVGGIMFEY